jgi:flagellar basal-body rod modification protein FlgD
MEVNNLVLAQLRESTGPGEVGNAQAADELQDRFMTLLITQIKNQDPLNPLDNAEVTSQLAQLNMVGGIERLNERIEAMAASFLSGQSLQAASLVGRNVLVEAGTLDNTGQGGRFGVEVARSVDAMSVSIVGPTGDIVERIDLGSQPAGLLALEWDGLDSGGQAAPAGSYRIEITATSGGDSVPVTALAARTVSAVTTGDGKVQLELSNAGTVSLGQVRQFI